MRELRPLLAPGDAPLVLTVVPRPLLDGSVRPLRRGLLVAAALALPALGPLAAEALGTAHGTYPEPGRLALAAGAAR